MGGHALGRAAEVAGVHPCEACGGCYLLCLVPSLFFAAQTTVWEKIQDVPSETWANLGVALLTILMVVRLWRTLRDLNDFAPWIALFLVGGSVLLYWVYERTEPKFLSPVIEWVADILPSNEIRRKDPSGGV